MAQEIEQVIPDYELLAKVGEGGYGEVYLARSITGQYRAIKIIYRERMGSTDVFEREFRGTKRFETVSRRHGSLVDILHVGRNDQRGFFYYVMDVADDERQGRMFDPATYRPRTLRSELSTRTALPMEECIAIGLNLASALIFLQENGLIHRDIKPANIVFINGKLKLADIGLVADMHDAKSIVGTPGYEPPEHHGAYSGDVYSLGKLLYEISTGRDSRNFGEAPSDEADTDDPRFARFNEIVCKACAKHYKDRYQTAKALFKALTKLGITTPSEGKAPLRWVSRLPWLLRRTRSVQPQNSTIEGAEEGVQKPGMMSGKAVAAMICLAVTLPCEAIEGSYWPQTYGAVLDIMLKMQTLCYVTFAVLAVLEIRRKAFRTFALLIGSLCVTMYLNARISQYFREQFISKHPITQDMEPQWENRKFPDVTIRCPTSASIQKDDNGLYVVQDPRHPNMAVAVYVHWHDSTRGQTNSLDNFCQWVVSCCEADGYKPTGVGFKSYPYQVEESLTTTWFRCDSLSSNGILRCEILVPVGDVLVRGGMTYDPIDGTSAQALRPWVQATCAGLNAK